MFRGIIESNFGHELGLDLVSTELHGSDGQSLGLDFDLGLDIDSDIEIHRYVKVVTVIDIDHRRLTSNTVWIRL